MKIIYIIWISTSSGVKIWLPHPLLGDQRSNARAHAFVNALFCMHTRAGADQGTSNGI